VAFGLDPVWLSAGILAITYAVLLTEKVHRTVVALLGACAAILLGVLTQDEAAAAVDYNTIALLMGMMIIVAVTQRTGVFEFLAIWSAKKVKADPRGIMLMLVGITAVCSAFLDNLTTVILIVPVALLVADKLQVSPYPFLISQILAANIGGTATLIGDPPNILIGSATGLTFMDFITTLGPVAALLLVLLCLGLTVGYRKSLVTTPEYRVRIMQFKESDAITDMGLLRKSMAVLALVVVGFVVGESHHIRPGTTALTGAGILLLISALHSDARGRSNRLHDALAGVEWSALLFFAGLFAIVHGVERAGLLAVLGEALVEVTGGDQAATAYVTLWMSAVVSAAVDNIPFVATMIPVVESMEAGFGGAEGLVPIWWSLALGACLGGNGSLIGAAANVMVAGLGERAGYTLSFARFAAIGIPVTLLSVLISHVYVYMIFF